MKWPGSITVSVFYSKRRWLNEDEIYHKAFLEQKPDTGRSAHDWMSQKLFAPAAFLYSTQVPNNKLVPAKADKSLWRQPCEAKEC